MSNPIGSGRPAVPNNCRVSPRERSAGSRRSSTFPNLIDIQKRSYEEFLQRDVRARASGTTPACRAVFKSVFPIKDFNETASLEFVELHARRAQVRRRRVPPARHDLRRAAQGHHPARHLGRRPGERRALDQERQGAGGLLRRDPADDAQRHVHDQRHRAGHRAASCIARRASSSTTTRARRTPAASCSTRRASSRTAARGSTSSSIRATSSSSASTGAGSSTPRSLLRALGMTTEDLLNYFYKTGHDPARRPQGGEASSSPISWSACKATRDIRHPQHATSCIVKEGRKITKAAIRQMETAGVEADPDRARGGARPRRRARRRRSEDRRGAGRVQPGDHRTSSSICCASAASTAIEVLFLDDTHIGPSLRNTLLQDKISSARGGDPRDLPAPPAGRSADARDRDRRSSTTSSSTPSATTSRASAG